MQGAGQQHVKQKHHHRTVNHTNQQVLHQLRTYANICRQDFLLNGKQQPVWSRKNVLDMITLQGVCRNQIKQTWKIRILKLLRIIHTREAVWQWHGFNPQLPFTNLTQINTQYTALTGTSPRATVSMCRFWWLQLTIDGAIIRNLCTVIHCLFSITSQLTWVIVTSIQLTQLTDVKPAQSLALAGCLNSKSDEK